MIPEFEECKVAPDPVVDLVEGHPLLGGGQRQADQRRVGVGRLRVPVLGKAHQLEYKFEEKGFFMG